MVNTGGRSPSQEGHRVQLSLRNRTGFAGAGRINPHRVQVFVHTLSSNGRHHLFDCMNNTDRPVGESKTLIALSGGIDSVVCAHSLVAQGADVSALHFSFHEELGKKARSAAELACDKLNIPLLIIDLQSMAESVCRESADPQAALNHLIVSEWDTPAPRPDQPPPISPPYPAFAGRRAPSAMLMLCSTAAFVAQLLGAKSLAFGVIRHQTERNTRLLRSIHAIPNLIEGMNPARPGIEILTPLAELSKPEVVRLGLDLGVNIDNTWSCLSLSASEPCGSCPQCTERQAALTETMVTDDF